MSFKNTIKSLGPGLLWAGAAVGVSHLVQSTRAGAIYGFQLVGIILLINLFKYPFLNSKYLVTFSPPHAFANLSKFFSISIFSHPLFV